MTEQPGIPDQFKDLVTENEKRMKAIQDQIANQLEAQRKAVTDLVESQQKAFADFLEQQRSVKIADHWEAQRKAISEQIEHQRKAFTDLVERQWTAQKKAIEDAQHAIVGIFRPKPDEPKSDEPKSDESVLIRHATPRAPRGGGPRVQGVWETPRLVRVTNS
jgi:predicted DNA-binding protein YlxM (UPF0122 family)